jgi:hypothetical protein
VTDHGAADGEKPSLGDRLRAAFLKPTPQNSESPEPNPPPTLEELEAANRTADDHERAVGLFAAPCAALISLLIIGDLNAHNRLNVSSSVYTELLLVLVAMAVLMVAFAWFRKRLFLGLVMALYGLAVFNLKYWGFGVPFLLGGAWLLVRAYRAQRAVREATDEAPRGSGRAGSGNGSRPTPAPSKRYTPPSAPKRSSSPKPDKDDPAG